MILGKRAPKAPRTKSFSLKGGLNTEVANMERKPGEMLQCINYNVVAGAYSGYQSMGGYERFDGQTLASTISSEAYSEHIATNGDYSLYDRVSYGGYVFFCIQASGSSATPDATTPGDNTWWELELVKTLPATTETADTFKGYKREIQRALILPIHGSGARTGDTAVRGIHTYVDTVYAWQNNDADTETLFFKSDPTGWIEIPMKAGDEMDPDSSVVAITGRMAEFPVASPNERLMFWVDSVTDGFFWYDGTNDPENVTSANLPSGEAPLNIGIWENRLFLVYAGGHIFFSNVGDPTNWDSATGLAGEIYLGDDITGLVPSIGKLVIFTKNGTKILHYGSTSDQFVFKLDDYSQDTGAIANTVISHYENIFFCSNRSASRMFSSAESGGFAMETISDKIARNYIDVKGDITSSIMDNARGRYYAFYDNYDDSKSFAYTFTLYKGKLKGVGRLELEHRALVTVAGLLNNGTDMLLFGDSNGYVYKMESGTDFDGEYISTILSTSFYHYGSPRNWKHFTRLTYEIDSESSVEFTTTPVFDYADVKFKKHEVIVEEVSASQAIWGENLTWGSFIWGGGQLGVMTQYISGHGQNMSVLMTTKDKFAQQHTISNITTDYQLEALKQ